MTQPSFSHEQKKVLAHALREAMVDLLKKQPMTAKEVATALGSTVGNAHYHLQRLVAADLVTVSDVPAESGALEKRYRPAASLPIPAAAPAGDIAALLALDETLWLTVAETGQLVNEVRALVYRWRAEHSKERGRAQPLTFSVRCDLAAR